MNYDKPELRERLASEYVLGTLHGQARKRFQRLIRADLKTRVAVELWEQRLMPMGSPLTRTAPSGALWKGIEHRIAPQSRSATQGARPNLFERFFGLRALGPLAAGIAVGVIAMLIVPRFDTSVRVAVPQGRVLPEAYAGFLADQQGQSTLLISSQRHGKVADLKWLRPVSVAPDQVLQLWALAPNAAPISLGIVAAQEKPQITMPDTSEKLLSNVTELAVSVEPRGTAPVAQPSVPYLLRGPCAKFW
ncbi:MAG: anti-sigma factor domain-containing protein [Burkholderiales bacterium]